ncbi:MAG: peptidase [Actinobacteria bacterium]|nr:peptidase [Actinomycetota bacterium]
MSDIRLSPFQHDDHSLAGLVVSGRWPNELREWVQLMLLLTRLATTPGLLSASEIYAATDDLPEEPAADAVGVIMDRGPAHGVSAAAASFTPTALLVLHPPGAALQSPGFHGTATGALLLPGLPHIGLQHQAAWVEVEPDGTVARLTTALIDEPARDADVAVLAQFLAA